MLWALGDPQHGFHRAYLLNNLGNVYSGTGIYGEAKNLHERALAIRQESLGADHPDVADSLSSLALVYQATGAYEEAKELLQRALAIWQQALGADHPFVAYPVTGLAAVALAQRRPAEAIGYAERAAALREGGKARAELLAASRFVLARALWEAPSGKGRDRARAVEEARRAADLYRGVKGKEKELAEVEAWIAERRDR